MTNNNNHPLEHVSTEELRRRATSARGDELVEIGRELYRRSQ